MSELRTHIQLAGSDLLEVVEWERRAFFVCLLLLLPALGSIKLGRYIPHPTQTLLCEEVLMVRDCLLLLKTIS